MGVVSATTKGAVGDQVQVGIQMHKSNPQREQNPETLISVLEIESEAFYLLGKAVPLIHLQPYPETGAH